MRVSRRRFLFSGVAAGGLLALNPKLGLRTARAEGEEPPLLDPAAYPRFVDPLPVPPTWTGPQLAANGLTMAEGVHRFHRDFGLTRTWGYGGLPYLGPIISVDAGAPVTFTARNRLGAHVLGVDTALHGPDHAVEMGMPDALYPRASLHLHGGYTAPGSDGYPEDTFAPGEDHVYTYTNDQGAGNIWYHDHALGITRLNVYAGLAGLYMIRDGVAEMGLPPARWEIPIVLQDKSFMPTNAGVTPLYYPDPWAPEFFGNVPVINGAAWPRAKVRRGKYRLRFYSGATARIWDLRFDPPLPMVQVGTDDGLLPAPVPITHIVLAPGERADVVVDFRSLPAGYVVKLNNQEPAEPVTSPAEEHLGDVMAFEVLKQGGFNGSTPSTLATIPDLRPHVARDRWVSLTEVVGPDGPVAALLNNRYWDTADVEKPTVDTVERWHIVNLTADTHPVHLHLIEFLVEHRQMVDAEGLRDALFGGELTEADAGTGWLDRGVDPADYLLGSTIAPPAEERGWKDTVQAHPGQVTTVLVPFGPNAAPGVPFGTRAATPFTGQYVWHCHILDHEDNEMMLPYEVLPA